MTDLVAGHVKLGSVTWTAALGQIRAGTVLPLAVSSARPMPDFPGVPTMAELGYPTSPPPPGSASPAPPACRRRWWDRRRARHGRCARASPAKDRDGENVARRIHPLRRERDRQVDADRQVGGGGAFRSVGHLAAHGREPILAAFRCVRGLGKRDMGAADWDAADDAAGAGMVTLLRARPETSLTVEIKPLAAAMPFGSCVSTSRLARRRHRKIASAHAALAFVLVSTNGRRVSPCPNMAHRLQDPSRAPTERDA